jgi:di/tricarboxylate transporter
MLPALPDQLQPWAMATLLAGMIAVLVIKHFGTDIVLMGVLTACVLLGLIEPAEAVGGFANQGLATVGLLYIVAAGMKETGATTMLVSRLLGRPKSLLETQARLTLPVAGVSAFVNNTPIVAMFLPTLAGVARRGGFPASKLFMPLSFASILGGVCTMIGTSTNIVVADLVNSGAFLHNGAAVSMGMFSLTPIGLPIAVLGLGYMLLLASRLLPDRDEGRATDPGQQRQYMVAMRVPEGSALAGRSIEQAGLRNLPGLFLARVDRGETSIVAVDPDERLRADDVLSFVGNLESVVDLQRTRGLEPITDEQEAIGNRSNLTVTEVVVSASSALIGRSIRDCGIRTRYNAVVVAVHRRGHRLAGKIGSIVLQAGDTLLLETDKDFIARHGESRDFYLATERAESAAPRHERAWVALVILGPARRRDHNGRDDPARRRPHRRGAHDHHPVLHRPPGARERRLAGARHHRRRVRHRTRDAADRHRRDARPRDRRRRGAVGARRDPRGHLPHHRAVQRDDDQHRRRRAHVPHRDGRRVRSGARPDALRGRHRDRGLVRVLDPDRIPDKPNGHGPGRVPLA